MVPTCQLALTHVTEVGLLWTGDSLLSSETEPKPSEPTLGVRHFGYAPPVLRMTVGRGW
jgi:hypothetical protein